MSIGDQQRFHSLRPNQREPRTPLRFVAGVFCCLLCSAPVEAAQARPGDASEARSRAGTGAKQGRSAEVSSEATSPGSQSQPAAQAGAEAAPAETWAGHQLFLGARSVPILGNLETRSETFVIAEVERAGDEIHLLQRLCKLEVARFAGVRVSFLKEGVPKMPPTPVTFQRRGEASFEAVPWTTEWTYEDVDQDGKPGATVVVEAPICGGTVFVGSTSRSIARGTVARGALEGEVRVNVAQRILETSNGCIGLVAKDTEEKMLGTFSYVPVPAGSTCESLLGADWPTRAPEPQKQGEPTQPKKERRRPRSFRR